MRSPTALTLIGCALLAAGQARAATNAVNNAPPAGPLVEDLAGLALPTSYTNYTASFVASTTSSVITWAFRNDPGYFGFDDASVSTGGGANLLTNPGFEAGPVGSVATGWTAYTQTRMAFPGEVGTTGTDSHLAANSGSDYWYDGSTGGYDGLSQTINTVIGQTYTISYELTQYSATGYSPATFQRTCTNGNSATGNGTSCNGVDALVYAGSVNPFTNVPEPASLAVLGSGMLGLLRMARRRQ